MGSVQIHKYHWVLWVVWKYTNTAEFCGWCANTQIPPGEHPVDTIYSEQVCCAGRRRRPFTAEAQPIGKSQQFSKIAVTFESVVRFGWCPGFRISKKILWLKAQSSTLRAWRRCKDNFTNHYWMNVEQPLASPGCANKLEYTTQAHTADGLVPKKWLSPGDGLAMNAFSALTETEGGEGGWWYCYRMYCQAKLGQYIRGCDIKSFSFSINLKIVHLLLYGVQSIATAPATGSSVGTSSDRARTWDGAGPRWTLSLWC